MIIHEHRLRFPYNERSVVGGGFGCPRGLNWLSFSALSLF